MSILDEIFRYKHDHLDPIRPSLSAKLRSGKGPHIIGEIKRGSPSKGCFAPNLDVRSTVERYHEHRVSAFSVLTDEAYFYGSFSDLAIVSKLTALPVLCKDFIVSETQIAHAYANGASVILLIARMLEDEALKRLIDFAHQLHLEVLMEIHTAAEFERIREMPFDVLGINNRNLASFETDVMHSVRVYQQLGLQNYDFPVISESGFESYEQVCQIIPYGFCGALIGEHMVKGNVVSHASKEDAEMPMREPIKLQSETYKEAHELSMPKLAIKICGVSSEAQIDAAAEAGASHVGFVLAESRRQVTLKQCQALLQYTKLTHPNVQTVIVMKNVQNSTLNALHRIVEPDFFQLHGTWEQDEVLQLDIQIIRAFKATQATLNPEITMAHASVAIYLIDSNQPGSGETFDWSLIEAIQKQLTKPMWIAGGLEPDNVKSLLSIYPVSGVDVSSGVETDGRKDLAKIRAFISNAKKGREHVQIR